jgi:hypothetical protein
MLRNRNGQVRVLEALLASAVIFSALFITVPIRTAVENSRDREVLYEIGLNMLIELDRDGELGSLIAKEDWLTVSKRLSTLLPLGVAYNLTVYDEDMAIFNNSPVSGGGALVNNVLSIQYLLAARVNCQFYVIRLQLSWMK